MGNRHGRRCCWRYGCAGCNGRSRHSGNDGRYWSNRFNRCAGVYGCHGNRFDGCGRRYGFNRRCWNNRSNGCEGRNGCSGTSGRYRCYRPRRCNRCGRPARWDRRSGPGWIHGCHGIARFGWGNGRGGTDRAHRRDGNNWRNRVARTSGCNRRDRCAGCHGFVRCYRSAGRHWRHGHRGFYRTDRTHRINGIDRPRGANWASGYHRGSVRRDRGYWRDRGGGTHWCYRCDGSCGAHWKYRGDRRDRGHWSWSLGIWTFMASTEHTSTCRGDVSPSRPVRWLASGVAASLLSCATVANAASSHRCKFLPVRLTSQEVLHPRRAIKYFHASAAKSREPLPVAVFASILAAVRCSALLLPRSSFKRPRCQCQRCQ